LAAWFGEKPGAPEQPSESAFSVFSFLGRVRLDFPWVKECHKTGRLARENAATGKSDIPEHQPFEQPTETKAL